MSRPNLFFFVMLSAYTLAMRLMPWGLSHFGVDTSPEHTMYPWNFSPMSAFCLFGAAYYAQKRWIYMMPIAIWFAGDLGIWALSGQMDSAFHYNMLGVYTGILLVALIGTWLREKRSLSAVLFTGLIAETVYFVVTNLGEWRFSPTYTKDLAGLENCFIMAIPFFKSSVLSTLFFSAVIFSPFLLKQRKAQAIASESKSVAT